MAADYQLTLTDYLMILRRRALLLIVTFAAILAISVAVALLLPPVFQSTGTILVESQQISSDLIKTTVTGQSDERIAVIKQRVMTRENLQRIIDKYGLYKDARSSLTPTEVIDQMRSHILVEMVKSADKSRQTGDGTIAFTVSFEHRQPELALRTANELVTLFLNENVKARTENASQTTEFLTQEADKIRADLDRLESQIATYKQENVGALPENIAMSSSAMQRMESELRDTQRDRQAAQDELAMLDIQLSSAKAGVAAAGPAAVLTPAQELERARADYARLSATYTENHPDVRAAKRKIETLQQQLATGGQAGAAATTGDPAVAAVQVRINATRARVATLDAQERTLRDNISKMEQNLGRAPQVERGLSSLMRDQQNALKKYEEIRAKQMTAQVGENLEEGKKAERFSLLEPPLMPDRPVRPNRKKMIALGFAAAVAGALGLAIALETIHGRIRGAQALEAATHLRPLAIIPYLTLQSEIDRRRLLVKRGLIGLGVVCLALLASVHFFIQPLDILYLKILTRLS